MVKNKHREPTLYIVGNEERADEIRHIIEDEWMGDNVGEYKYNDCSSAYCINSLGIVSQILLKDDLLEKAVEDGWMKEYKLPQKPQFKPFDKVVARSSKNSIWFADFYNRYLEYGHQLIGADTIVPYCLPYNGQTAKLIGTSDEWKGGVE